MNTICELQRKIDAYENYILGIFGFSSPKKDKTNYVVVRMGTDMDGWVQQIWKNIESMKEELRKLKEEAQPK